MSSLTPRLDKLDKNYIINGNFDYWQRGISFISAGAIYTADRMFCTYTTGTTNYTRSTDVPDANSTYSLQIANTTGTNPQVNQRIESIFAKDLANKTVTFKCKVKASDATGVPIRLQIQIPTVTDIYSGITVFTDLVISAAPVAGNWITFSTTISLSADVVRGMNVVIYRYTNGIPATTTTLFSQLQVIIGDNADTDFSYAGRNIVEELQLCQRYFERSYDVNVIQPVTTQAGAIVFASANGAGGGTRFSFQFKVNKRAIPTIVVYNTVGGAANFMRNDSAGLDVAAGSGGSNGTSGGSASNGAATTTSHIHSFHYTADAEL